MDSPYGEFELGTPAPYHFTFIACATNYSLASNRDGQPCARVVGMQKEAVFKFGAPPTAGQPPIPVYTVSNRSLYVKVASEMSVNIQAPQVTIKAPKVELDEYGRIKSVEVGGLDVKSMGGASASVATSAEVMTAEELKTTYGIHCVGYWVAASATQSAPKAVPAVAAAQAVPVAAATPPRPRAPGPPPAGVPKS